MTQARKAVIENLHRAHIKQKTTYDQRRKEVSYQPGDLVLVYKPFRQVGKAEKLLHRWLGPHEVIRKTTDLNYEVRLTEGRKDKSDIVHVVAVKPFYPPDGQRNKTNHDERRGITTSDAHAEDGKRATILSGTEKRKPGRPRKIIADIDPGIAKTHLTPKLKRRSEPELTRQGNGSGSDCEPLPKPEDKRPTRTRTQPNRFVSFIHALLLLTVVTVVTAESPIMDGVHFKKEAPIIFSDFEWIMSTDVKFTGIQNSIKFFRQQVSQLDLDDFLAPSPKDSKVIKHVTPSTESIGLNTRGPTNYVPGKTLRFLHQHFEEKAKGRLTSLTLLENRLEKLTDLIYQDDLHRIETKPNLYKRGAMDAGGDLLKRLFGTANEKDLHELNVKLRTMRQTDVQIINSLEDQATLFTNGLHRTTANTKLIQEVRTVLASLDQATSETIDILKEFLMKLQLLFEKRSQT